MRPALASIRVGRSLAGSGSGGRARRAAGGATSRAALLCSAPHPHPNNPCLLPLLRCCRHRAAPLVCRRWSRLVATSPALLRELVALFPRSLSNRVVQFLVWLARRAAPRVQRLHLEFGRPDFEDDEAMEILASEGVAVLSACVAAHDRQAPGGGLQPCPHSLRGRPRGRAASGSGASWGRMASCPSPWGGSWAASPACAAWT